ncbi:MAG: S9 family peptidase, partial [Luteimonas sp.]
MPLSLLPIALLLSQSASAADTNATSATKPLTLAQVMADPDWIGPPVEDFWWSWDSRHAQYELKRAGGSIRDAWSLPVDGSGGAQRVDGAARATLDASGAAYDATRSRMAFIRNGDVFVRDLRSGALVQVTRSNADETLPQWSSNGTLTWRAG